MTRQPNPPFLCESACETVATRPEDFFGEELSEIEALADDMTFKNWKRESLLDAIRAATLDELNDGGDNVEAIATVTNNAVFNVVGVVLDILPETLATIAPGLLSKPNSQTEDTDNLWQNFYSDFYADYQKALSDPKKHLLAKTAAIIISSPFQLLKLLSISPFQKEYKQALLDIFTPKHLRSVESRPLDQNLEQELSRKTAQEYCSTLNTAFDTQRPKAEKLNNLYLSDINTFLSKSEIKQNIGARAVLLFKKLIRLGAKEQVISDFNQQFFKRNLTALYNIVAEAQAIETYQAEKYQSVLDQIQQDILELEGFKFHIDILASNNRRSHTDFFKKHSFNTSQQVSYYEYFCEIFYKHFQFIHSDFSFALDNAVELLDIEWYYDLFAKDPEQFPEAEMKLHIVNELFRHAQHGQLGLHIQTVFYMIHKVVTNESLPSRSEIRKYDRIFNKHAAPAN